MMRDNKNGKLETHKGERELRRGERLRSPHISKGECELRRGERLSEPAYKSLRIDDFLSILSSTSPMPGGGVVVSLVAANAVNLSLKVINLSIGKKKYIKYDKLLKKSKLELELINDKFLNMMDEDAIAFKSMEEAYKMPKDTKEEILKKEKALQKAYKICIKPVIEVIKLCNKVLIINKKVVDKTTTLARSDIYISDILIKSCIESSIENIKINTNYMKDKNYVAKINKKLGI